MRFKRFIVILLVSLLAALTGIAALPRLGLVRANSEMIWVAGLYAHKEQIAASMHSARVLVVGGSATLHGFDSVTASQQLGRPTINFGTHASLGLAYILDRAERAMRQGDIVLLAPEYDLLQQTSAPNSYLIQLVTFYDPGYLKRVSVIYWPSYILGYGVIPSLAEAFKVRLRGPVPIPSDLAQDQLGNNRGYTVARSVARQQLHLLSPITPAPVSDSAKAVLRNFAAVAAERHVTVFVLPVPLIHTSTYPGPAFENYLASLPALYASLGLSMVGTPSQAFLPIADIHDVPYHANDPGRAKYTETMLSLICRQTACPDAQAASPSR